MRYFLKLLLALYLAALVAIGALCFALMALPFVLSALVGLGLARVVDWVVRLFEGRT